MELGSVGSGLDVESIVKALVDADVAPKTNALNRKRGSLKGRVIGCGSLNSVLSSLETSLAKLSDGTSFDFYRLKVLTPFLLFRQAPPLLETIA